MTTIPVKICGITRTEDALIAEYLGAAAIGFVFYPKSKRYMEPVAAGEISEKLGPFIARVGVFVDENPSNVREIVRTARLTAVQLHGAEDQSYIDSLDGVTVIKAFRVGDDFDPDILGTFRSPQAFLLDTAGTGGCYGGTGKTFDWSKAEPCKKYGRIILAGGLNPENTADAIQTVRPWAVDVSSGVEISFGVKDEHKIAAFMETVKGTDAS